MPNNENENVSTVNETIVTGKKYRVLKDKINGLWNRISFWTSANDVEFTDSGSLQGMRLNEVVTSIQNSAGVPGDSVVILDNNDAVPEGWELTTKPQDIVDLENAVDELNDNLTNLNNSLGTSEIIGSFNSTGEKTLDKSIADYREILILAIDSNNFIFGQAFLPSDYIQSNLNQGIVFSYNNAVSVYSMKFTSSNEVNIMARTGNADLMKIIGIN